MRLDDAVRTGITAARAAVLGQSYEDELTESVFRQFSADAGACLVRWDVTPSGVRGSGLSTCGVEPLDGDQVVRAQAAAPAHPGIGRMLDPGAPSVTRVSDLVDLEPFWDSEVYEAMHGHSGSRFTAGLVLQRTPGTLVFLGVDRQCRDLEDDEVEGLTLLGEPLRAALELRDVLDRAAAVLAEAAADRDVTFSPRECDVLTLVTRGWTSAHIGRVLGISESAVKKRLESARDRVGVSSRAELVALWAKAGR